MTFSTTPKLLILLAAVCTTVAHAHADFVPIDPSLFTHVYPGTSATWSGNSLTLDFPISGGYTQTGELSTNLLPANIMGISFTITSSLSNPRVIFGYNAYNPATGNSTGLQGYIALINYFTPSYDLTTFGVQTVGFGNQTTYTYLGSYYTPLLFPSNLTTYPLFSLDFQADGYDTNMGTTYPGTVTFSDINWIVTTPPPPPPPPPTETVPLPAAAWTGMSLLVGTCALAALRRKLTQGGRAERGRS